MKKYNFNENINRRDTYSTQWDYAVDRFGTDDVLPFSISDTDFRAPKEVVDKLIEIAKFGVYGYTRWNHEAFKDPIRKYYKRRHNTNIDEKIIVYSPSVMYVMSVMIKTLSKPLDEVLTFSPMYDAFYKVIQENNRTITTSKLINNNSTFEIDWEDFEIKLNSAKIFILCSPHNPTGRVWRKEELVKIVNLCIKHDVWIISDEIHSDVVHGTNKHIPILNEMFDYKKMLLISSASKTFNTPGLIGSYAVFNNIETADMFVNQSRYRDFLNSASLMGMQGLMVAYSQCDYYIEQLKVHVYENYLYFKKEIERISFGKIMINELESTYLIWFDISGLEISSKKLQDTLINVGKIGIMSGEHYGDENYMRINIGCTRDKLEKALFGFEKALDYLNNMTS